MKAKEEFESSFERELYVHIWLLVPNIVIAVPIFSRRPENSTAAASLYLETASGHYGPGGHIWFEKEKKDPSIGV